MLNLSNKNNGVSLIICHPKKIHQKSIVPNALISIDVVGGYSVIFNNGGSFFSDSVYKNCLAFEGKTSMISDDSTVLNSVFAFSITKSALESLTKRHDVLSDVIRGHMLKDVLLLSQEVVKCPVTFWTEVAPMPS